MLDKDYSIISKFRGIFNRGAYNVVESLDKDIDSGFLTICQNFLHSNGQLVVRPGFRSSESLTNGAWAPLVKLIPIIVGGVQHFLLLDNTAGPARKIFSTFSPATMLFQCNASELDFNTYYISDSAKSFFGQGTSGNAITRAYLTLIDTNGGGAADSIKVTDLISLARNAAGTPPATVPAAANGGAGKVEAGTHLISVVFETDSGFVTKYSIPATVYVAPGGLQINLTAIPTGPAGTIARQIVATKVIRQFNGDTAAYEMFFIPNGRIADNVTTVLTIDFYDTELVASADSLNDLLSTIPCGIGMCTYNGRLVIWGESASPVSGPSSVVRVSNAADWEAFSSIDGYFSVYARDGDGVTLCFTLHGNLYICKKNRTYVTRDNGGPPNSWIIDLVDGAIGASGPFAIGYTNGSNYNLVEGGVVIGHETGIYFFNGIYNQVPLTYNIDSIFRRIFNTIGQDLSISIDIASKNIAFFVRAAAGGSLYVGNYENGLSPENIAWSVLKLGRDDGSGSVVNSLGGVTFTNNMNLSTRFWLAYCQSNVDSKIVQLNNAVGVDGWDGANSGFTIPWQFTTASMKGRGLDIVQVSLVRAIMFTENTLTPNQFDLKMTDGLSSTIPAITVPNQAIPVGSTAFRLVDVPVNFKGLAPRVSMLNAAVNGGPTVSAGHILTKVIIDRLIVFHTSVALDKARGLTL